MRCEFCPRPPRAEEIDDVNDDDFGESRGAKGGDRKASTEERDEIVFDIIFRNNAIEKKRDVLVVFFICVEFLYLSQEKRVVFFPDKTKTLNVCLRMEL